MYVETFHCALKVAYLDIKQNHCVDHLLTILLYFVRDKVFKSLKKTILLYFVRDKVFKSLKKGNRLIESKKSIRGMSQLKK